MHQNFTGGRQDLLTLEDQIFSKLVSTLDIKQSSEELARTKARPTGDIKAYEVYMKGRKVWRDSHNAQDLQSAIGLFNQAIKLDPQFALAYAGLADADRRIWDQTQRRELDAESLERRAPGASPERQSARSAFHARQHLHRHWKNVRGHSRVGARAPTRAQFR